MKYLAPVWLVSVFVVVAVIVSICAVRAEAQQRDSFQSLGSVNGCELYAAPRGCFVLICGGSASLSCR